jgi:uncharacterized protein with ParB-like and HNH nuclease domain
MAGTGQDSIKLKTVNELLGTRYFIPAYQRGYRWEVQQINDLLDDINVFSPKPIKNSDEKTWYCLQPLIVKKNDKDGYTIIDGQQRLTTIYIILHYLNQRYTKE